MEKGALAWDTVRYLRYCERTRWPYLTRIWRKNSLSTQAQSASRESARGLHRARVYRTQTRCSDAVPYGGTRDIHPFRRRPAAAGFEGLALEIINAHHSNPQKRLRSEKEWVQFVFWLSGKDGNDIPKGIWFCSLLSQYLWKFRTGPDTDAFSMQKHHNIYPRSIKVGLEIFKNSCLKSTKLQKMLHFHTGRQAHFHMCAMTRIGFAALSAFIGPSGTLRGPRGVHIWKQLIICTCFEQTSQNSVAQQFAGEKWLLRFQGTNGCIEALLCTLTLNSEMKNRNCHSTFLAK